MKLNLSNRLSHSTLNGARWVLASRGNALLAALIASVLPLVSWLAGVVVTLVTLIKGYREGFWVLLAAYLPIVAFSFYMKSPTSLAVSLVSGAFPLWLMACVLRRTQSLSLMIAFNTLLCVSAVGVFTYLVGDNTQYWLTRLQQIDSKAFIEQAHITLTEFQREKELLAAALTHLFAFTSMIMSLSVLFIARMLESKLAPHRRFGELFAHLRLGYPYLGILFIANVLSLMKLHFFQEHLILFFMPAIIAGLSLIQFYLKKYKINNAIIFLLYTSLAMFAPIVSIVLSIIAMVDQFFNFRHLANSSIVSSE